MDRSEAGRLGLIASLETRQRIYTSRREAYTANPVCCLHCVKPIPFEKKKSKFCNHSCAASYLNAQRTKNQKVCVDCGQIFPENGAAKRCKVCVERRKADTFEKLRTNGSRKRWLIKERGHKCETCGYQDWMGQQIILTLDHTDGNPDNNHKSNLKLLCWNCHAMTPTFGAKNVGRFPDSIRKKKRTEYFLKYAGK